MRQGELAQASPRRRQDRQRDERLPAQTTWTRLGALQQVVAPLVRLAHLPEAEPGQRPAQQPALQTQRRAPVATADRDGLFAHLVLLIGARLRFPMQPIVGQDCVDEVEAKVTTEAAK